MMKSSINAPGRLLGALAWAVFLATAGRSADTNTFGFTGPEIYPWTAPSRCFMPPTWTETA